MSGTLPDLLISTVHRTGARPERKATQELVSELRTVAGKQTLLFWLAEAAKQSTKLTADLGLPGGGWASTPGQGTGPGSRRERDE